MGFHRYLLAVFLLAVASGTARADELASERIPYVIGASVSKGFNLLGRGHSPPIYALNQMGYEPDEVVKKTVITGSFRRKVKWLKESFAENPPEIVFGIDLFHHDAKGKEKIPDRTFEYLDEMIELLCEQGVPVIVGTIWTMDGYQTAADKLNEHLASQAELRDNLYLFPAAEMMVGIKSKRDTYLYEVDDTSLLINYKRGKKLLLDVVHPNKDGARLMANILIEILNDETGKAVPYYDVADVVEKLSEL